MTRACALLLVAPALGAQSFSGRGYFETRTSLYPQTAEGDSGRIVTEELLRLEGAWKPAAWAQFNIGLDARFDSHRQFARSLRLDFADLGTLRPALSVRRLSLLVHRGGLNFEAGRQAIRWGKADILNPTDRFAPKDFLNVLNSDFLAVTAARLTYERGSNTIDAVYQPLFTPSRGPLFNQRWVTLDERIRAYPLLDQGARYPGRGAVGARFNHLGRGYEAALSYYDGFNHLPSIAAALTPAGIAFERRYARFRMIGADAALPLRWFTVKAEAARFHHQYTLYVLQLERQSGEWTFVGGYAGEIVSRAQSALDFAPDRGLARTFLGRASYAIDANRNVAVEAALRQNGRGCYAKAEYSHALGAHWRATATATLLRGRQDDFLGQYRRNSNLQLILRYSF